MKILLIDPIAAFLDFALRCEAEGHEVLWWVPKLKDGTPNPVGDGLIRKIPDWKPKMSWADLILSSDNARYTRELEGFRTRGCPLWACNVACAAWELDRSAGQRVLEDHGIPTIPSIPFKSFSDAIKHVHANPVRYVCKPNGDVDKALSYVAKGPADLLFMLERWKSSGLPTQGFILQEFHPGIEMAVGGWMGRDGFLSHVLENFEFKKLMPGEVGPNTGEMGTVMKYCRQEESKLAQEVLLPLESALIREGYTGFIDVSVIIDNKGKVWPLEFTTRPGWPLFQIQQVLHPDICGWMKDALEGRDTFQPYTDIALGIVVAIPDFPYNKLPRAALLDFPVWGLEKARYFMHPSEVKLGAAPVLSNGKLVSEPTLVSTGNYLITVSGRGETVCEAKEDAYDHLRCLEIPNSPIYRTDIGCRLENQLVELQKLGYAESWDWGK